MVQTVDPSELTRRQEASITGKALDLVSEVYLNNLDLPAPVRIFHKLENESRLIVAVPGNVPFGKYDLEFKWSVKFPFSRTHTSTVPKPKIMVQKGGGGGGGTCPEDPIVFADLNWDSAQLQNAIAKFILEKGYECETDAIFGGPEQLWGALVNGDIHVMMEAWLPNHDPWWMPAMEAGSAIPLGRSLDDNWQSAFFVPDYVIEGDPRRGIEPMAPGLKTVQDIREYKDLFVRRGGRKAVLVGCLSTWACAETIKKQVKAYGLDDVIEIQKPASSDLLFGSLERAYEQGKPWLGYMWGPATRPASELDLIPLEEPPYTKECWESDRGCAYPIAQIRIVVHPSLLEFSPIVEFLRKWDFPVDPQIAAETYLVDEKSGFEEAAIWYLENYQAVWFGWVPRKVADKVIGGLKNQ